MGSCFDFLASSGGVCPILILIFVLFFLTLLILIVFWKPILFGLAEYLSSRREAQLAFPECGSYRNAKTGLMLTSSTDNGTVMKSPDGEQMQIHIDFGGNMIGEGFYPFAYYKWNQKKDILYLEVKKDIWELHKGQRYAFLRIPD